MLYGIDIGGFTLLYFAFMNITGALICLADKRAAKKKERRVPEKTILFLGAAGGALGIYLTMKKIRHKTLHKKFMIGLPLMMIAHFTGLVFLCIWFR